MASTRTVSVTGCPGAGSRGSSKHSITVAIRFKILVSKAVLISANTRDGHQHGSAEVRATQLRVVVETASKEIPNQVDQVPREEILERGKRHVIMDHGRVALQLRLPCRRVAWSDSAWAVAPGGGFFPGEESTPDPSFSPGGRPGVFPWTKVGRAPGRLPSGRWLLLCVPAAVLVPVFKVLPAGIISTAVVTRTC